MKLQPYRRTSSNQNFTKAGIPCDESDYYRRKAQEESNKANMPPQRIHDYQYVFITIEDDEDPPKELTYEEAVQRAYRP